MLMRNGYRVLLLALLLPTATLALGLGDIHLRSALNAPLDADIDVVGASAEDLAGLKASLASRDTFGRYGLDYPAFLGSVTLLPQQTADGRTVIHVHSTDAVNEPFATLLVEVNWARGHLVREYTVLLDPPVFSSETPSAAAVAAPVTGDAARSGSVERRASNAPPTALTGNAVAPQPTAAAPVSQASPAARAPSPVPQSTAPRSGGAAAAAGGVYSVRSGDTLSSITAQVYGAGDRVARQRELVGVYRANTQAFDGNMNLLRAGSVLALPGDAELAAISPGEAATEVHRQYSAWNAGHAAAATASAAGGAASGAPSGPGQLRLVPPQESAQSPAARSAGAPAANGANSTAGAATTAAAAAATAALQQRLSALETQLAESQRLLQLKNAQLAAMQARPAAGAPAAPAPAAGPVAPSAPATTPPAVAAPAPQTPPPPAPTAATQPKAAPPAAESGSFVDLLEQYWYLPAALLAVLIALLVMRAVRARQEDAFDRSLGRLAQPDLDAQPDAASRISDTMPVRALAPTREEQSYRVEESGSHEQPPAIAEKANTGATGQHVAIEENVPSDSPVALDQGDPLAEADFHMAYGLYDQAADLVQIAISREPARRDLRLKLLEVFFVWGNKERFLNSARELAATRDKALPGEWEKIVIMGRQIAPEDPLFANSGALPGAASGGVDLNLEGGQNRIDFDLMGEPTVSAPRSSGIDLDLGSALGNSESTGEHRSDEVSGVDFVFDDAERGNEATGSTREMPSSMSGGGNTATVQVAGAPGADPDAPTVEQPQLPAGDNPTIRQKLDAATRAGVVSSEQTAELELHDLGLDLGPMGTETEERELPDGGDAPTMLAGLDDETRQLLSRADKAREDAADATAVAAAPTDSGTWLFTDTDFADVMPDEVDGEKQRAEAPTEIVTQISPRQVAPGATDNNATAQLAALDANDLDLDLSDLKTRETGEHDVNGVDLDVGPAVTDGTFVQTQRIMAEDVALPDLEPATMSEVGTKLDLARAYMDMGDPEGARSILSEVLLEGSVSQKQEARRLIDTLPG